MIGLGGSGGSSFKLDAAPLNATYGDNFDGTSLNAKWTRVGYIPADEVIADSFLYVPAARAAGNYYYQAAPPGDFTVTAKGFQVSGTGVMFGPMIIDDTGAGVGVGAYNAGEGYYAFGLAAAAYGGTSQSTPDLTSTVAFSGEMLWWKLRKAGGNYFASMSTNGQIWRPETAAFASGITPTRIGFGGILATSRSFAFDWFNAQ